MHYISFQYLFRDGGNYKTYGALILANPKLLSLKEASIFSSWKIKSGTTKKRHNLALHQCTFVTKEQDIILNRSKPVEKELVRKTTKRNF